MDGPDNPRFIEGCTTIDVLHELLWLQYNGVMSLPKYFDHTDIDIGKVKLLAPPLAGKALAGGNIEGSSLILSETRTLPQKQIDTLLVNFEARLGCKECSKK